MLGGQQPSRRPQAGRPMLEENAGRRRPQRWLAALASGRMAASMAEAVGAAATALPCRTQSVGGAIGGGAGAGEAALAAARTKSAPCPPICTIDPGLKARDKLKVIKRDLSFYFFFGFCFFITS